MRNHGTGRREPFEHKSFRPWIAIIAKIMQTIRIRMVSATMQSQIEYPPPADEIQRRIAKIDNRIEDRQQDLRAWEGGKRSAPNLYNPDVMVATLRTEIAMLQEILSEQKRLLKEALHGNQRRPVG